MLVTALCVLLSAGPTPGARGIATARGLVDDFQFAKAISIIGETLKEPGLDTPTLITLYELEGIAHATSGAAAPAKDSFARLLTLDPAHAMPGELPPKGRTLYFGARTVAAREVLELVAEVPTRTAGLIDGVAVTVKTSSLLPATGVRFVVSIDDGAPTTTVVPLDGARLVRAPARGAHVKWSAALLGANDSILRRVERDEVPLEEFRPPPPPPVNVVVAPPVPAPATWVRPLGVTIGIIGLVGVGVGAGVGVMSTGERAKIANALTNDTGVVVGITQAEAARLDASARTEALAANVLMIAGSGLAATGLLMFVLGPAEPAKVSLSVGPGGVTASGRF